jgi:hypothetical protein
MIPSNAHCRTAVALLIWTGLAAGLARGAAGPDPLNARERAIGIVTAQGLLAAHAEINKMLKKQPPISSAFEFVYVAELMKLTGDYRAPVYYQKAIDADPQEPASELLFGEYMRNFRGPLQPLYGAAESHLKESARKLACIPEGTESGRYGDVREQLTRSIVSLTERDGFPLFSWATKPAECLASPEQASLFFSTGVRGGEELADLDVTADVSDLTSAALYSQSLRTALGPLSTNLLEGFLRTVTPFENRNRIRTRYKGGRLDLFFNDHTAGNAAITHPDLRDPTFLSNRDLVLYNPLKLLEYGVSANRPFQVAGGTDADIAITYRRVRRTGLIDDHPNDHENINQLEIGGVISHLVGPDKASAQFTFVDQWIMPDLAPFGSRGRQIYAGTLRYQAYRFGSGGYSRVFQSTRGLEFYAGALHDRENYGYDLPAIVTRGNYFAGFTIHAIDRLFDFSVQPTWFTSEVPSDRARDNQQYRTAAYALWRIRDEERVGPRLPEAWHGWYLGFVHLTVPFHYDSPQKGLPVFVNYKVGAELAAKWFTAARGGTTFLGSARYDVEQFNTLNRSFSLFTLGVTMGF